MNICRIDWIVQRLGRTKIECKQLRGSSTRNLIRNAMAICVLPLERNVAVFHLRLQLHANMVLIAFVQDRIMLKML